MTTSGRVPPPAMPLPPVPMPVMVNLESTLGCNLSCVMCGSHLSGVTKVRRVMAPELVQRVEREVLPDARDLSLTVAGEPFMTPKVARFVALSERTGAELQLNSNATLIREGPLLTRVLAQASVVKFSVDGATAETYEAIRHGAAFQAVCDNIRLVVRVRATLPRAQRPRLALCMVLMRRNIHELADMVDLVASLGVDRLEVAHLTVLVPEMDAESLHHHPDLCDRNLRAARARADALGVRVTLPPLMSGDDNGAGLRARARLAVDEARGVTGHRVSRLVDTLRRRVRLARWSHAAGGRVPCHFLQGGVFITIGGDVAPCPMPGRPIVGNLMDASFLDIWNGPTLTAMRRGLMPGGTPFHCCAHCSQNPEVYTPGDPMTAQPDDYARELGLRS